ncbi:hypothetical protein [Enterobacter asburiae]|uniref:hypothetical protein n=1 Tax=Enterobacter asburiae TaxID=61645 RepID=UPI001E39C4A1|nr:hypothetical protein [Enterobacter asburiae]MCE2003828.1 hypothetical protein [Enterobacter asburiae]
MTPYEKMSDAELDAEIARLAVEIAGHEYRYDAEYLTKNHNERLRNQATIRGFLLDTLFRQKCAMKERRRRMGFWIAP